MQRQTAPQAPIAPVVAGEGTPVPSTRAELEALQSKRRELNNQLEQLTSRRKELQSQRERMGLLEGKPHEARIQEIDARSASIDHQIFQADEAIAKALASGVTTPGFRQGTSSVPANDPILRAIHYETQNAMVQALMIGASIAVGTVVLWRGFRRYVLKRTRAVSVPDHTARLEQLQRSMDTIAIEVERISEAQRFSAKLLKEKVEERH